jgi:plastocyanin
MQSPRRRNFVEQSQKRKRATISRFAIRAICLIGCADTEAKDYFVIAGGSAGLAFSPQTTDIVIGDTVTFLNFGGLHNVVADDGSFRCAEGCDNDGHGGTGAPSGELWSVTIPFSNAGTVGYFCETHGSPNQGMFGTINVSAATVVTPAPTVDGRWRWMLLCVLIAAALVRLRRAR